MGYSGIDNFGDLFGRIAHGQQKVTAVAKDNKEIVYRKFLFLFLQKIWNSSEPLLSVKFEEFNPYYKNIEKVEEKYSINDAMLEMIYGASIYNYSNDNKIIFLDIDNILFPVFRNDLELDMKNKGFKVIPDLCGIGFSIARNDFYNRIINKNGIIVRDDIITFLLKCNNEVKAKAEKNKDIIYNKILYLFLQKFLNSVDPFLSIRFEEFNLNYSNIEKVKEKYSINDDMLEMIYGADIYNCFNDNKIIFLNIDNELFPVFRKDLELDMNNEGFNVFPGVCGIDFSITRKDFYNRIISKDDTIVYDGIDDELDPFCDDDITFNSIRGAFCNMMNRASDIIHGAHNIINVGAGNCKKELKPNRKLF